MTGYENSPFFLIKSIVVMISIFALNVKEIKLLLCKIWNSWWNAMHNIILFKKANIVVIIIAILIVVIVIITVNGNDTMI